MNIYYDLQTKKWYYMEKDETVTFGGESNGISFQKSLSPSPLEFKLNLVNAHAGPLVGIMTTRRTDGTITGNSALFMKLQTELTLHGGLSYIFTPEDANENQITGYVFLPDQNAWKKAVFPYPDLVYNRVPFRRAEQSPPCQSFFTVLKQKNIPFFNPCFLDKYELYCLFQRSPSLKGFLPKTDLVGDKEALFSFLSRYHRVYLKPTLSSKGKGIYRITHSNISEITLEGLFKKNVYHSFHTFWEEWAPELTKKQYLVQEEISSAHYEGKKFDLRILAHSEGDRHTVTGVGVRQAQEQDLTTHVPNGGKLLPYELFQTNELDRFIEKAVHHIGKVLSKQYGFFGEFSIDAGISERGEYFIYEVNSKPMSFDETDIEKQRIIRLCKVFFQLANFPFTYEETLKLIN